MTPELGPYETNAVKILEPLRLWKSRNFGFLTPQEATHLTQIMEAVTRRAKAQDEQARGDQT